jgi:DNA polymerase-3 subunit delta
MAARRAQFGTLTVVFGPDSFLAERAVARAVAELRSQADDASVTSAAAAGLDLGLLQEMTGADLFSTRTVAVVTGAEKLPKDLVTPLTDLARDLPDFVALICQHAGGNEGRGLLDALKKAAAVTVECQSPKPWKLAEFVQSETAAAGGRIDGHSAELLVDAVGQDTRALAGAVAQLLADAETATITAAQVQRYFAGRAGVTGFAVADDVLAGRTGPALVKLRWALATGVAHPQITAALAGSLRLVGKYLDASRRLRGADAISQAIGARGGWQVDKTIRPQSRGWTEPGVAAALRAVAEADANVKGAAGDPDYALEQAVLRIARLRGHPN